MTRTLAIGAAIVLGVGSFVAGQSVPGAQSGAPAADTAPARHQVLFNLYQTPVMTVFIADADGADARALVPDLGLEYSPAFSADGEWVVFTAEPDGQADVYRIRPDGTGLEQLTDHPAFDDQGALSPDGRALAFVSTRARGTADIWLLDLDSKTGSNLTDHPSGNFRPRWSPDGAWIAFTSDRDAEPGDQPGMWEHLQSTGVYVVRPDGTGLRRLTAPGEVAGSPSWSADGRRLIFYETDPVGAYLAKAGRSRTELAWVDVGTGERVQITASQETKLSPAWLPGGRIGYVSRAGGDQGGLRVRHPDRRVETVIAGAVRSPSWSPDGGQVAYERIERLGYTQHMVPAFSPDPEFELFLHEPFVSFSPDGDRMIFSQYRDRFSDATGLESSNPSDSSLEIMSVEGTDQRTLFHREGTSAFSADWSAARDEIVLSVGRYFRRPGLPAAQVAVIDPHGSDLRLVVDDEVNNGFPSWSPDGGRIVYKGGRRLFVVPASGGDPVALTGPDYYSNFPHWSPDGSRILFTSNRDGDFELYTVRPDGTDLRRLTHAPGNDAHSTWCAGGEWIVFSSSRTGFKDEMALYDSVPQPYGEIFAMRADGTDVRQLTDNKWEDSGAVCVPERVGRLR